MNAKKYVLGRADTFLKLYKDILIGIGGQLTVQESSSGNDELFFSNGDIAVTKLNGVNGLRKSCFFLINIKL
ncbi:hypothetical protein SAMN05660206_1211 [Sphingobacterium wenxiniae]|uniref:Uncharacterized protein n=1 Tax=Sphingobacterium wenxiniae TaxID=683125 RepID=A0A1I6VZI3_9SPHI|nr:hypothetical protein SAMN05660206_1211 [Sphingobacterium wenxiniae]